MLSLMKKYLHLYLDQGIWSRNLLAKTKLKLKMYLVVQILYLDHLNQGEVMDLEKVSLLDLIFNFI